MVEPDLASRVVVGFRQRFSRTDLPSVYFAPGRVNLIGDHIDYCGGTVLPMPVQFGTWLAIGANHTGRVRAYSENEVGGVNFAISEPESYPQGHWGRFVSGALTLARERIGSLGGADIYVLGNLPSSGLSSSASFACGLLFGLLEKHGLTLPDLELALLARRVEHEFVGVNCGLMDQAVVAMGAKGAALLFDCATNTGVALTFDPARLSIVVVDSGVPRRLAESGYNTRRLELSRLATILDQEEATLALTLREADLADIADPVLKRRAKHIWSEQKRTLKAASALGSGDWTGFGVALNESHQSLQHDYEVSCEGVDALVALLRDMDGCYGARMTGGGFGGAVVAAFEPSAVPAELSMDARYGKLFVAESHGGVRRHA